MDVSFILWFVSTITIVAQIIPTLALWSSFSCVCVCVYTFVHSCVFEYFFLFESYKMLQDHPGHFMPQSYNQQFLPKSPFSFSWRMVLETKIWAVGVLFAKGV